jgi:hypothetical protein
MRMVGMIVETLDISSKIMVELAMTVEDKRFSNEAAMRS